MEKRNNSNNNNNGSHLCRNHDDDVSTGHDSIACANEGKLPYHLRIMAKHNSGRNLGLFVELGSRSPDQQKMIRASALNLGPSQF